MRVRTGRTIAPVSYTHLGIRQTIRHAALPEEIAEHQAANQRSRGRQEQDDEDGNDDREEDLLALGDDARLHLSLIHICSSDPEARSSLQAQAPQNSRRAKASSRLLSLIHI